MTMILKGTISDTTPSSASTAVSAKTIAGLDNFEQLVVFASLLGATGGVLDVYLQTSWDGGTTWYDWAHFTQLSAGNAAVTYAISSVRQTAGGITAIGKGTVGAPGVVLAANTTVPGAWGPMIRAVYVAGASTSAGAAQSIVICGYIPHK